MQFFLFLIFSSLLPFCVAKTTIPALLIDYDDVMGHLNIEPNPFLTWSASEFADIVEDALNQCIVLILFIEETLSTEDISMRDELGSSYTNLREKVFTSKVKYITNVINPVKTLTRLLPPKQSNVFILDRDPDFQPGDSNRFFYVFFNDNEYRYENETRAEMLRRHDKIMEQVYTIANRIAKGPVVGLYTGKVNPVFMRKPEYEPEVMGDLSLLEQTLQSPRAFLRFTGVMINSVEYMRRASFLEEPFRIRSEKTMGRTTTTKVGSGLIEMEFSFVYYDDYWSLEKVKLFQSNKEVGLVYLSDIAAPYQNSFYCDEPLFLHNSADNSTVYIPEYQIVKAKNLTHTKQKKPTTTTEYPVADLKIFSTPILCNRYFSIPIISGLIVTALFLSVTAIGVHALLNCHNNDRFDDPHGKPLVITIHE